LRAFATADDLFTALRAGATMPVLAGPPVSFGGRPYLDASITEPVPVPIAEAEGFTHIVALLTRPAGSTSGRSPLDRYYVVPRLRRLSPALAARYAARSGPYNALLAHIARGLGPDGRALVLGLRPTQAEVSRLERDSATLRAAAQHGFDVVLQAFRER
jgi:predicted patatin/cPLA2 family phospholipase